MDTIFAEFRDAQSQGSGSHLSSTLLPVAPNRDPSRLRSFYNSTVERTVEQDIRSRIVNPHYAGHRISKNEGKAWTEVYVFFWRFIGTLLSCQNRTDTSFSSRTSQGVADWSKVYMAWRDVANALIKGYSSGQLQAWTIPCLYVAGRYLRIFSIRADDEQVSLKAEGKVVDVHSSEMGGGFQDDIMGGDELNRNEKLEDAARVINRIFTLCISDR